MHMPVILEALSENQFRATGWFDICAEGATADDAVASLRDVFVREFSGSKRIVLMDIPIAEEHPWMKFAGHLKNDPLFDDWQAAIADYRREQEQEDDDRD